STAPPPPLPPPPRNRPPQPVKWRARRWMPPMRPTRCPTSSPVSAMPPVKPALPPAGLSTRRRNSIRNRIICAARSTASSPVSADDTGDRHAVTRVSPPLPPPPSYRPPPSPILHAERHHDGGA